MGRTGSRSTDANLQNSANSGNLGKLGPREISRRMRRFCGPRGGAARQDVLAATDVDVNSNDEDGFPAWPAFRNAKAARKGGIGGQRNGKAGDRVRGGSQTLNGIHKDTGFSNRCCWRGSEYIHIPKPPLEITSKSDSPPCSPASQKVSRPP